jgi:hypothetical protein
MIQEQRMNRFDRVDPPKNMSSKFEKTGEGYLKGVAPVCSVGVYQYLDGAGNVYRELRLPDEVFKQDFLDSLKNAPLTLYHPTEFVTMDNIDKYKVGALGTGIKTDDGIHVATELLITSDEAIAAVYSGIQELSVGYTCDHEESSGVWLGMPYDRIQRNLKANHVSIVPAARGGETLRIRLDSVDTAVLVYNHKKEAKMPELKTVKLDGVEYQAEAKVVEAMHLAVEKRDALQVSLDANVAALNTLKNEKTQIEAERDTLKDRCDGLETKVSALEAERVDAATLNAAVMRRVALLDAAKNVEAEVNNDMSDVDIQKTVIMKVFPKAVLDGKDDAYIAARFDGAMESLALMADAGIRQATIGDTNGDASGQKQDDAGVNVDEARSQYVKALQNAYKGKEA